MKYGEMLKLNWLEVDNSLIDLYVKPSFRVMWDWLETWGISCEFNDSYGDLVEMFVNAKEFQSMGWEYIRDGGLVFIKLTESHIDFLDYEVIKFDIKNYKNPSIFVYENYD